MFVFLFISVFLFVKYFFESNKLFLSNKTLYCTPGELNRYDVIYSSKGNAKLSLIEDKDQFFQFELKGNVNESCISSEKDFVSLKLDFSESNLIGINQYLPFHLQNEKKDVLSVFVKLTKTGAVQDILFHKELNSTMSHIYRDYIANSFVDFSNYSDGKLTWRSYYKGYNEDIYFNYSYVGKKVERYFLENLKEKESFKHVTKNPTKKYLEGSKTVFEMFNNNIPRTVEMKRLSQSMLEGKIIGKEETLFSKKHFKTEVVSSFLKEKELSSLNSNEFFRSNLAAPEAEQRLNQKIFLQHAKYKNFDDFLSKTNFMDQSSYTDYFLQLKSLFNLEPKSTNNASKHLISLSEFDDSFMLIVSALSAVGTPESQNALIETYHGIKDEKAKMSVLANLGLTESPTLATEEFLRNMMSQQEYKLKNTAILAMGNIGQKLLETDTEREEKIYKELMEKLITSNNDVEKKVALLSLGNLSDKRALSEIYKETNSTNETLRQYATFALRFIEDGNVDIYLRDILKKESSERVKVSALQAMTFRKMSPESLALQKETLRKDVSEIVRMEALSNLAQAGEKEELLYAKENESSQSIRNYAENLLAKY